MDIDGSHVFIDGLIDPRTFISAHGIFLVKITLLIMI